MKRYLGNKKWNNFYSREDKNIKLIHFVNIKLMTYREEGKK